MPTLDTIELIYKAFQENPNRLKSSTEKLQNQYKASQSQVQKARKLYRINPKDFVVAQAVSLGSENLNEYYTDSIPASELFEVLTGERGIDDWVREIRTLPIVPIDSAFTQLKPAKDESEDQWEVKQKWVKNKETGESSLLIRKTNAEDFKTGFEDFLNTYNPKSNKFVPQVQDNILLVYTSDKHIGAKTKENSLFDNDYSAEIFNERMKKTADEIIRLNKIYPFEQIVIIDLGDTVDGFNSLTTRGGHTLPQNMTNRDVYKTFLDTHLNFISYLVQNARCKNLAYVTAGESNHGGDFEWICNKSLETALNIKYPQIKTYIGDKFIEHFEFGDHCFIICHGKDIEDMKYPLPKNLDPKTELWIKSYIDQNEIKSKFISFVKGDLHLASTEYSDFFRYKNVLSMYGSSKWVQTNFMKNTRGVCMDIISNNSITEHFLFL